MTKEFKIEGMSCNHCVMAVKKNLANLQLKNFEVTIGSARVDFNEKLVTEEKVMEAIEDSGYKVIRNDRSY
jgi:copper chaperone